MDWFYEAQTARGLTREQIAEAVRRSLPEVCPKRVLLLPPDFTRFHSNAGFIANLYYHFLTDAGAVVDVLPAVGSHAPMDRAQFARMFGDIPFESCIAHDWRSDVVKLGEIPAEFLSKISEGAWREPIAVEINRRVMDERYELILSVGQVVPHEVAGMANHSKNLFVGVGGADMISKSHMVGALYGVERVMGRDHTPVRELFDYALTHFLNKRPLRFALTVTTAPGGDIRTHGLFIGDTRAVLEAAIALSHKWNMDFVDKPIKKCVVYLDPEEFKSTWIGDKAIYRTCMAMADGGELLILAPGVNKFGEDARMDALIRKYGYAGTKKLMALCETEQDLRDNLAAAAHLLLGCVNGRFRVVYAVKAITQKEIRDVYLDAADYDEQAKRYDPFTLQNGWNRMPDGEEIYFIPNPALGLWTDKARFAAEAASVQSVCPTPA